MARPSEELGFGPGSVARAAVVVEQGAGFPADAAAAVDLLAERTASELDDEPLVACTAGVPSAAPGVVTGYLFGPPGLPGQREAESLAGAAAATAVRTTAAPLMDLDFKLGGGHPRKLLLLLLTGHRSRLCCSSTIPSRGVERCEALAFPMSSELSGGQAEAVAVAVEEAVATEEVARWDGHEADAEEVLTGLPRARLPDGAASSVTFPRG